MSNVRIKILDNSQRPTLGRGNSKFEKIRIPKINHQEHLGNLDHKLSKITIPNKVAQEFKKFLLAGLAILIIFSYVMLTNTDSAFGDKDLTRSGSTNSSLTNKQNNTGSSVLNSNPIQTQTDSATSLATTPLAPDTAKIDPSPKAPVAIVSGTNPSCYSDVNTLIKFHKLVLGSQATNTEVEAMISHFMNYEDSATWIDEKLDKADNQELNGLTDSDFIYASYDRILDKTPSVERYKFWLKTLKSDNNRSTLLIYLLNSNESKQKNPIATSSYCQFVSKQGGGSQVAPGVIYQKNGIEHIVFVDMNKVNKTYATAKNTGLQSTPSFANNNELTVAINANWFRSGGRLDGFVVSNGSTYGGDKNLETGQSQDHDYTALFGFDANNKVYTAWHGEKHTSPPSGVTNAISGHPSLTHHGKLASEYGFSIGPKSQDKYTLVTPNAHSAIGVSKGGSVLIMAAVDGKPGRGYSALQMAKMMQRAGAYESVMLDGSGSTSLVINKKEVTSSNDGRKVLANIGIRTGDWFEN